MPPQLIEEARRHQRRRRGITGAILIAPFAVGGLVVGLSLGGAIEEGNAVGTSAPDSPYLRDVQAQHQKSPATTETSSPSIVAATLTSERAAAALEVIRNAAAAQVANIRSNQLQEMARAQEVSQAADAEAQATAAAAAAAQR